MLIMRTNLAKGNQQVINVLKDTKHDKEKTYDKITAMMLDNCYTKIDQNTIDKILKPENINLWEESFEKFVEFNKNVFQIIGPELKYTTGEKFILDDITKVVANPGLEIPFVEEKADIFTEKLGRYKYLAFGMALGFGVSFILIFIYSYLLKKNK